MKISSSVVQSGSEHLLEKTSVSSERLDIWTGDRAAKDAQQQEEPSVIVELRFRDGGHKTAGSRRASNVSAESDGAEDELDVKLRLIEAFVYALTGKRIQLRQPSLDREPDNSDAPVQSASIGAGALGWGLAYDRFESYTEEEQVRYSSSGNVLTSDGRSISFT
jgi:hypothetical protein